ncbi:hypothetical protein GCK32_011064 [Trichostrongylus colubriformis]|uniref:Uncharacterized protein n=1 Tax=Trichostrongylus colubriformis TaxID=6319 RepID=A0AAN8F445_TRICO
MLDIIPAIMLATFTAKMFTRGIVQLEGGNALCMTRLAFGFMTVCVASNIFRNSHYVSKSMNCDPKVIPMTAVCEYIFLVMLLISYALDIVDTRSMRIMVSCSAQDAADYGNIARRTIDKEPV